MPNAAVTLLTMSDIAALAQVQRPVVTMWVRRYRGNDRPFPAPASVRGRQKFYDAQEIATWLDVRTLGNNRSVDDDLAFYAILDHGSGLDERTVFEGMTALLCLKNYLGDQLTDYDSEDLLDDADELDPNDEYLYSEIAALGGQLDLLARHVDGKTDSAYGAAQAFESIVSQRVRLRGSEFADSEVSPQALRLCASIIAALTDPDVHVFVDPVEGSSDLMVALRQALPEYSEPTAIAHETSSPASRLARRRLAVHGWTRRTPPASGFTNGFEFDGPSAFVVQFPSPSTVDYSDAQILSAIDDIAIQMSDDHVAVILAPASALMDRQPDAEAARVRSDILRSDRVRAGVRLPEGLLPSRPGTSMAVWVLGAAPESVKAADRWSVMIDVGSRELDDVTADGVVSDVVAAMGDWRSVHSHAFHFGVLVRTSALLAAGDKRGLAPSRIRQPRARRDGAELAAQILVGTDMIRRSQDAVGEPLRVPVEYRDASRSELPTLGQLSDSGELNILSGNRIHPNDVDPHGSVRVVGPDEVLGDRPWASRGIDRLVFSAGYSAGRYTEPGDIVFCTGPSFGAVVDHEGSSVVMFPARVIRIADVASSGLIPEVIAGHLRASRLDVRPSGAIRSSATWRRWEVPRVAVDSARATIETMRNLNDRRRAAIELLGNIDRMTEILVDGLAHDVLCVVDDIPPRERSVPHAT